MFVFSETYMASGMLEQIPFSEWLNSLLLPDPLNIPKDEVENILTTVLSDIERLKAATMTLYPVQYDFNLLNWPHIEEEIIRAVRNKRTGDPVPRPFTVHEEIFAENINTPFAV